MASSKSASRYATALLDLAIEQKSIDKVNADMIELSNLCKESDELRNMLKSPIVNDLKKVEAFNAIFGKSWDEMSLKFIALIVKNSRANIIPHIADSFVDQYRRQLGILDVQLTSATKLEDATKAQILAKIEKNFEGKIELHESIDKDLIGGFVVRIDDKQIDASIANQLSNLKNILLN